MMLQALLRYAERRLTEDQSFSDPDFEPVDLHWLIPIDEDGRLSGEGEKGLEGKPFLEAQMVKSGQLLGDIWYSAWQQAPPDTFLARSLASRKKPASADPDKK